MDGIIIIDKPKGQTSFEIVKFVRHLTGAKKVGHTGTLDPLATGVLPICLGKATKLVPRLINGDKEYQGEMIFGVSTDTHDAEGKVLSERKATLEKEKIEEAIKEFTGMIKQVPPMVSALHYKGERLYKLARRGQIIERTPRAIHVKDFRIIDFQNGTQPRATFILTCSKGTYVRTLCHDLGEKLGCGAHQSELKRVRNGPFKISEAYTPEALKILKKEDRLGKAILSIEEVLKLIK